MKCVNGRVAAALAAGWLAACGPASPPPELPGPAAPAPIARAAATTGAPAAETPDEALRYKPPLVLAARSQPPPRVEAMTLSNGVRALLVERHDLPLVAARVVLRRRERPQLPRMAGLFGGILLDAAPAGDKSLGHKLWTLGAQRDFETDDDTLQIEIKAAAPVFGEALRKALTTLAAPVITQEALDEVRKQAREALHAQEPRGQAARPALRTRLLRAADEQLFPRDHIYSDFRDLTVASVDALKLADMQRYRDREVAPERVTVCVTGDVTAAALREAIESAAPAWKSAAPPAAKPPSPGAREAARPTKLARGVFLVEEPGEARADVAVVLPAPPLSTAQGLIMEMAVAVLNGAMTEWLVREVKTPWSEGFVGSIQRADVSLLRLMVEVEPAAIAPVVRGALDVLARLGQGEITTEAFDDRRSSLLRWQEGLFKSNTDAARSLSVIPALGTAPDVWSRRYQAMLTASQEDVARLAKEWLTRSEARVVAIGNVTAAKPELEKLGLGPVTLRRAAPKEPGASGPKTPRKSQ